MSVFLKIVKWILLFAVVIIVQMAIVPKIAIFGIYPDLVMILLVVLSVENGRTAGIWGGFFTGLFIDVFSGGLLGINALAKTIVGGVAGLLERKNILISPVFLLILLIIACVVHDAIIYIPNIYHSGESFKELPKYLLTSALPRAVYTTFIAAVVIVIWENFIPIKTKR